MDPNPTGAPGSNRDDSGERHDPLPPTQSFATESLKGRYLLGTPIGRGGFATTYLATDIEVAFRKVVVKILLEHRSEDSWSLKKFRGEMEALARIDHPNVVSVIDYGQTPDGRPFLVMQYVAGTPLRAIIPREGMALARVGSIMQQIGRALTAAHEAGVFHRDLKPENVMIQSHGDGEDRVKLIDFGVAVLQDPDDAAAQTTKVAGTPVYMAPEQFHGKFTARSDIFQMGVVAYELVTGSPPFRASTPGGILTLQMDGVKVEPKDLRPELPEAAQEAILRALRLDPRDRFEQAREFGDALAGALGRLEEAEWTPPVSRSGAGASARAPRGRWIVAVALFVALLAVAAAWFWYRRPPAPQSVAVLPFENRIGDPKTAYLTEGITEALIDDLSRIPPLRVIARASVLRYQGGKADPLEAGRSLHVDRVITGSVSQLGDELGLQAEMIDVHSGTRLWGHTYTQKISSLSNTLEEFSTEVSDQLRLKLSGPLKDRLKRQYAVGSESYQEYLRGRFNMNKRTAEGFDTAVRSFNQVLANDSGYAPAYAGLAQTYELMAFFGTTLGGDTPLSALGKSRMAAERALALDSTLAEPYSSIGYVNMQADYQWEEAEKNFLRAIELNPNWPDTHEAYAMELTALGRFPEALREIKTAEDLGPGLPAFRAAHAVMLNHARRYDESLAIFASMTGNIRSSGILAYLMARNYWAKSMPAEALGTLQQVPATASPDLRIPLLSAAYARAGQPEKAKELLDQYVVREHGTSWYYLALAHLALGRKDDAMRDLENGYQQRAEAIMLLGVDPMLDELRADARFKALLARINLNSKRPVVLGRA